ncbi:MAG: M48 family metalloprotease [Bacteroidetes bacterium]|nr:M48 family metalloprotease [Bacteroidota bacterium]
MRWRAWTPAAIVLLIATLFASGCTIGVNPVSGNRRAYGYSWEEELRLGRQADQQIVQQYGLYDNEEMQAYVDRLGRDILEESHMRRAGTPEQFRNTEFTFRVLDSPIVNAFALPGGYVYITRGLLAHVNNEAQLAVVLGHEIAHVAARHASQQAAKQQLAQLGLLAGAIGGELAGLPGGDILQLGGQATQLLFLKYSRDNERESDRLGVEYAAMNGYAVNEASRFFESLERIQEQSGQSLPTWQSSHPDPGAREQTMLELAEKWRAQLQQPLDKINQATYYDEIEGLVLGENPRQGFTRDGRFYHPDLRFQFPVPSAWQVNNQPRQVVMVSSNQNALMVFTIAQEDSPEAAAQELAGQQGLTVLEQGDERVSGLSARRVLAEGQTQQGQTVRMLAYFIAYDGNVYQFQGLTLASAYDTYRPTFQRTMRGFATLNDSSILSIQPTRLTVRPAERSASFEALVAGFGLPESFTINELAILNQLAVEEQVSAGRSLKLVNK